MLEEKRKEDELVEQRKKEEKEQRCLPVGGGKVISCFLGNKLVLVVSTGNVILDTVAAFKQT